MYFEAHFRIVVSSFRRVIDDDDDGQKISDRLEGELSVAGTQLRWSPGLACRFVLLC